jgi:hypothetical protein
MSATAEQFRFRGAPPLARLAAHVIFLPNGCWGWTASLKASGYGSFWLNGKCVLAHCASYQLLVGPIPTGFELDHLCHTNDPVCMGGIECPHRRCVNPAHLEPVTHLENVLRGESVMAARAAQTHCIHGHELTEENVYLKKNGNRECRACWPRHRAERRAMAAA